MNPRDTETQTPPDELADRDANAPSETAMADAIAAAAIKREQPPATGRTLNVDSLQAYYGDNHAVRDISLDVRGEPRHGHDRPVGLRQVHRAALPEPHARGDPERTRRGQVMLDDIDIYDSKVDVVAVRRAIGMVFQKPNPFPTMSIFDNVAAGLRLAGIKGVDTKQRVEESLRGAGLWDEVKDRLGSPGIGLSGGQQQRLCIARTHRREARGDPHGRALLGPGPDRDAEDRGAHRASSSATTRSSSSRTTCSRRARVADTTAFFLLGDLVEHAPTGKIFSTPDDSRTEDYVSGKFG